MSPREQTQEEPGQGRAHEGQVLASQTLVAKAGNFTYNRKAQVHRQDFLLQRGHAAWSPVLSLLRITLSACPGTETERSQLSFQEKNNVNKGKDRNC